MNKKLFLCVTLVKLSNGEYETWPNRISSTTQSYAEQHLFDEAKQKLQQKGSLYKEITVEATELTKAFIEKSNLQEFVKIHN